MGHLHAPSSHRLVHLLAALAAGRRDLERATRAGITRLAAHIQSCVLLLPSRKAVAEKQLPRGDGARVVRDWPFVVVHVRDIIVTSPLTG